MRSWIIWVMALTSASAFGAGQVAQTSAPVLVRDPQAVTLLTQALAHLKSTPAAITDINIAASATYTAGSDHETGTATLQALGGSISPTAAPAAMSRVVLNLDSGPREKIRNGTAGTWSGVDGQPHPMALQNCWDDAAWFYPLLAIEEAAADPAVSIALDTSSTPTNTGSAKPVGIVISRIVPHQAPAIAAFIQKLSTIHLYLDPSTLLPVEIDFNAHPDRDARRDIPVEIEYSDYHPIGGALVPFHIQKFIQHSLLLDLHVTSAAVNTGLTASVFALPATSGGQQ